MEAQAARWKPTGKRWRHALESRRVLAVLLIAPAVIFMALVVGLPFAWAIYLSFTDAIGGSLTGNWVGFDNFTNAWQDENFRRAVRNTLIFTLASQAVVLVGAAVLSNFLVRTFAAKWIVRFSSYCHGRPRPLDHRLALAPRLPTASSTDTRQAHIDNGWSAACAVNVEEDAQVPLQWLAP
jgi:ABC-type Fe3+ transport system permease subunit